MPADTDDAFARQLLELRREYLADSPKRIEELRELMERLGRGDVAALAGCRQAFHRLAGSGGSYGFPLISTRSREAEHLIERIFSTAQPPTPADMAAIAAAVAGIATAFDEARRGIELS